jgi:hypothetical protein
MQHVYHPLTALYQTQLEASRRMADAVLSSTQKLDEVLIGAARRTVSAHLELAEEMAALRFSQPLTFSPQSATSPKNWGNAVSDQQEIMRIFVDMQAEISKSLQDSIGLYRTFAPDAIESTIRQRSRQPEDAMNNPVSGMISVWETAFKAAADLARKNMSLSQASTEAATVNVQEASDAVRNMVSEGDESSMESPENRRSAGATDRTLHLPTIGRRSENLIHVALYPRSQDGDWRAF